MTRPIHIMHVLLSLQPGGLENGVVNVVNGLDESRFTSSVCCLQNAGVFAARLKPGVKVTSMGLQSGNDLGLPWRLAQVFRQMRPDIIHTRNAESYFYGFIGAKLAGVRCVIHSEHGRTFDDRAIRFHVQRWFSRSTQAIFTVSEQLKHDLVRHVGMPDRSVHVLQNGVDTASFSSGERLAARAALGVGTDTLVIGSVGRLVHVKNYALLLHALAGLEQRGIELILIGDGPELGALQDLAAALGLAQQVHFTGHREDVGALLPALDVFVLPSLSEGMSNTLLEAMAAGVPCIASNVGGNAEIVKDGVCGFLFPSGDEECLRRRISTLCSEADTRRLFGEAAQARVRSQFSLQAMVDRYEALYSETAARHCGIK